MQGLQAAFYHVTTSRCNPSIRPYIANRSLCFNFSVHDLRAVDQTRDLLRLHIWTIVHRAHSAQFRREVLPLSVIVVLVIYQKATPNRPTTWTRPSALNPAIPMNSVILLFSNSLKVKFWGLNYPTGFFQSAFHRAPCIGKRALLGFTERMECYPRFRRRWIPHHRQEDRMLRVLLQGYPEHRRLRLRVSLRLCGTPLSMRALKI